MAGTRRPGLPWPPSSSIHVWAPLLARLIVGLPLAPGLERPQMSVGAWHFLPRARPPRVLASTGVAQADAGCGWPPAGWPALTLSAPPSRATSHSDTFLAARRGVLLPCGRASQLLPTFPPRKPCPGADRDPVATLGPRSLRLPGPVPRPRPRRPRDGLRFSPAPSNLTWHRGQACPSLCLCSRVPLPRSSLRQAPLAWWKGMPGGFGDDLRGDFCVSGGLALRRELRPGRLPVLSAAQNPLEQPRLHGDLPCAAGLPRP